jgi:hypothetical protein
MRGNYLMFMAACDHLCQQRVKVLFPSYTMSDPSQRPISVRSFNSLGYAVPAHYVNTNCKLILACSCPIICMLGY